MISDISDVASFEAAVSVHSLPAQERHLEAEVLARVAKHFATFAGTRRQAYDAMTAMTPMAEDAAYERERSEGGTVQGWWVRPIGAPRDRAILFIHGGGYMLGSAESYRGLASQVATRAQAAAFVPDYPLAPESPFPAAYNAVINALQWLGKQGFSQVAMVGDSAGGGLLLSSLRHQVARLLNLRAAVVFSPWTDLALSGQSMTDPKVEDPIFEPAALAAAASAYLAGANPNDDRASPLYGELRSLPPLLIQVGSNERLLDDARRFAAKAAQAGGEVRLQVFEGMHHVFQRACDTLPTARRALEDAGAFVRANWSPAQ